MMFWMLVAVLAQDPPKPVPAPPPDKPQARMLRDEDADIAGDVKEYTLDPKKSADEMKIGDFYMKKGSFNAAANRYTEATRWQPKNALAYLKLGEALERKDDPARAVQAYRKFVELAPGDKQAKEIKKKIEKLEKDAEK